MSACELRKAEPAEIASVGSPAAGDGTQCGERSALQKRLYYKTLLIGDV